MSCRLSAVFRSALLATAALGAMSGVAAAGPIVATDPVLAPYTLQYGDFNIVSLQFADTGTGTSNYFVQSAPGQIRQDVVIGTHAGGNFYNHNVSGMDDPYDTEDQNFPGYFRTGGTVSSPDPGGAGQFTGDTANSWDTTTAALQAYLGAANTVPVFYFNLNENGVDDKLSGTDMLLWAKVTISGAGATTHTYYLSGNPFDPSGAANGKTLSAANGGPDETTNYPDIASGSNYDPADPRWTYIHGDICVNGSSFIHYGKCTGDVSEGSGAQSVQQNLGANQAAFAAYSLALAADIYNPLYTTLQIDWRMADEDNGYEQAFILAGGTLPPVTQVPEGGTLALFGAGLIGAVALRRRRKPA